MEIASRITIDEKIRFGKPVVTGTRVPVDLILGKLAGGITYDELMAEYDLRRDDIPAALDYASKLLSEIDLRQNKRGRSACKQCASLQNQ